MSQFVIVIDTQRDFMASDGALSVAGAEALVAPMQAWLAALDADTVAGVLFTFDTHIPAIYAQSEEAKTFPLHCVFESAGWHNMLPFDAVAADIPVHYLLKGVFDMWAEPDIAIRDARSTDTPAIAREAFFSALKAQGISEVTVIGVAADYCVKWAIDGLIARDFAVTVPRALTRGIDRQIETVIAEDFDTARVTLSA